MRRLTIVLASLSLGTALVVGVPGAASAATGQFGNSCVATSAPAGATLIATGANPGNGIPAAAPASGIITKVAFNVPSVAPAVLPQFVKIMRGTGVPNQYRVVTQSALLSVPNTSSQFDVRIPVSAGDLLGLYGTAGTLICSTSSALDTIGGIAGDSAVGTTATYSPSTSQALPLVATVEPDADNDGYGDVTQDLCPQFAAVQVACPVIKIDSFALPSGTTINDIVATSSSAKVQVLGLAKVNGKKIKLKGGTKTTQPGTLSLFKVKLPRALKVALAAMPPNKRIVVTLTASTTDVAGRVFSNKTKVKLPGTSH